MQMSPMSQQSRFHDRRHTVLHSPTLWYNHVSSVFSELFVEHRKNKCLKCLWVKNMRSGHIKVKRGIRHLFYMSIPCHTIESVWHTQSAHADWTDSTSSTVLCRRLSLKTLNILFTSGPLPNKSKSNPNPLGLLKSRSKSNPGATFSKSKPPLP